MKIKIMKYIRYFTFLLLITVIIFFIVNSFTLKSPKNILHIDIYTEEIYYAENYSAKDLLKIQKTILGYYKEEDMMHYDVNGYGHVNEIDRDIIQNMNLKLYHTYSSYNQHFDIELEIY